MKTRTFCLLAAALLLGSRARAADLPCWGLLTGDNVRVRSGPTLNHRDMGLLEKGNLALVQDLSDDGRWLRIVPPKTADVWIFAKYVDVRGDRGVVNGDKVRVRVRPELTGEVVNQVNKGARVKVKGRKGDWLKIAPPKGTVAWVSTEYVTRMTETEVAAYRAEQARKKAEEERRKAELARLKAEAARRKREAALMAAADKVLAVALKKGVRERSLSAALRAYEQARRKVTDARLRARAELTRDVIREMQRVQAALGRKADPPALGKFDVARARKTPVLRRAVDELMASRRLAAKVAREARARAPKRPKDRREVDGWITLLGPGLEGTGASHRLVRDGRVLALIRSDSVDLSAFVGLRVRVDGRAAGRTELPYAKGKPEIIEVAGVRVRYQ
jgi:uncharacterized protein YgiM (DUF1202 family)